MKVLLIDKFGDSGMLGFAMRAIEDGHDVRWFHPHGPKNWHVGDGIVQKVDEWEKWALWADVVFLGDNTRYLHRLDQMRKQYGIKVVGASVAASEWELNRTLGQQTFERCGIPVPPYKEFSRYDDAIAYVKKENRRFVSKPCGDEENKALSYVAKSPADLVYMLTRWKRAQKLKGKFLLQEFIGGTEMAVGGWFGPGGFNAGWCENFEFKQLMAGDRGPNTGEMGTVVRYVGKSKLADLVLRPLEAELERIDYCGYIDVNCIIDKDGDPWPLEFTMRPGWPTFNIQTALIEGDRVEWLSSLAEGHDSRPFSLDKVATGVVLAIPDFPYSHITRKDVTGIPIYGLENRSLMSSIHMCGAMLGVAPRMIDDKVQEGPCYLTAGDYVLVATGVGESVQASRRKAYKVLDKIQVPNSPFWRPDIGERLKEQLPAIQAMGYAKNLIF